MSSEKRNCPRIELKYTSIPCDSGAGTAKGNWNNSEYQGEQNRGSWKL